MSRCINQGCPRRGERDNEGMCINCFNEYLTLLVADDKMKNAAVSEVKGDQVTEKAAWNNIFGSGCNIKICLGDLTTVKTDIIVNAANSSLQHASGLSGAIKKVAGQSIQDDSTAYVKNFGRVPPGSVATTLAYKLPCKYVVHTVGPYYAKNKMNEDKVLYDAAYNSFLAANQLGTSVSMPALSSGIFGYPVDEVANVLIQAALDFIKAHTSTTMSDASNTSVDDSKSSSSTQPKLNLKDICFTNFDSQTVNAFVTALNTTFKDITVNDPPRVKVSDNFNIYIVHHKDEFSVDPAKRPHPKPGFVYPRDDINQIAPASSATSSSSTSANPTAALSADVSNDLVKLQSLKTQLESAIKTAQSALDQVNLALKNAAGATN